MNGAIDDIVAGVTQIIGRRGPALMFVNDGTPPTVYVLDRDDPPAFLTGRDRAIARALLAYADRLTESEPE